jgi:hypothetical protein
MRSAFAVLTFAAFVSTGVRAADPPAPPAAMDVLELGETAQHAASRMPGVPAPAPQPKKQGNSPGYARADYVPDDVLRDRGFNAAQSVQQQIGFGSGTDVGREGRDVARDLKQDGEHGHGHGDGEGNGHHH